MANMKVDFNLDEPDDAAKPLDLTLDDAAPAPATAPPVAVREPPTKRLRLPLIGRQPIGVQLQVLATLFLVCLAFAAYVVVMEGRAATRRTQHLVVTAEIKFLTERIARLAPLAQGSAAARDELKAARGRVAVLLHLMRGGDDVAGEIVSPVDDKLRPALETAETRWPLLDRAIQNLPQFPTLSSSDAIAMLDDAYVRFSAAATELHRLALDATRQPEHSRALVAASGSLAMLMLVLFFRLFNDDASARQALLAQQRRDAETANAVTQAAIRQLMDEMTNLADGDLTARATVSENLTGAIADALNYAIEELSVLVQRINDTARRVGTATGEAARISETMLAASETQSTEIQRASGQVLAMAQSMNDVSAKAASSVDVARQSLDAANKGALAVADAIGSMDDIRMQIQETSKRIKRLGESSQEIGEIVELITDITDQTNVLALNAAIQAASAGEAGRGFSTVAEEVQRLAERSGDATRRIATLVKTIQGDTQGAVVAMENSTQRVIDGARLSEDAGQALTGISVVSRELAELIERIAADTRQQAEVASRVAQIMRDILRITEQANSGTRRTAISLSELADLAVELKGSVSGFKV